MTGLLASEEGALVDFWRLRAQRRARLLDAMGERSLDALILGRPGNVRYASGARQLWTAGIRPFAPACVVVAASGAVHLLSVWNEGVPADVSNDHLFGLSWSAERLTESLASISGMSDAARIGVDGLTPLFRDLFAATWPTADIVDGRPVVRLARRTKTPEELQCLRTAAAAAEAGLSAMLAALGAPQLVTERELTAVFAECVARLGVPIMATDGVACATDPRGPVMLRRVPSDRAVAPGQLVALDAGVTYAGYEGSLARTWTVGELGKADVGKADTGRRGRNLATRCWRALDAMLEQCRGGRTGADLASAWLSSGEQATATPLAYGVGLGAEPPLIGSEHGHDARFSAGDVLAVQAWVEEEGVGGFLGREAVIVTDGAPELLTRYPRDPA